MTEPLNVYQAITAVAAQVGAVGKDGINQAQKFKFRGIDAVVNAVSPAMRKHGLVIFPVVESVKRGTAQTSKGGTMNTVEVIAGYVFTGPDGSSFTAKVPGEAFDSGDKATAKAMSVAFRTALLQTFALPTDEVDPDAESHEAVPYQRIPRPQQDPDQEQDWPAQILAARNSVNQLRQLHAKATGMRAPQTIIEQIATEGRKLAERAE